MNNNISKMRLIVNSPVNISSGIELTPKDYLYDYEKGIIYFLNAKLWRRFIIKNGLLDSYQRYLTDFREKNNLLDWLKKNKYNLADIGECIAGSAKAEVNVLKNTRKSTLNNVLCQMKLYDGSIYIPGSSIKGFIKSAIMYYLLKDNTQLKSYYWNEIKKIINNPNFREKDIEQLAKRLEIDLLHKLDLGTDTGRINKKDALCSIMKGIKCSDAYSEKQVDTAVLQKIDLTFDQVGNIKENKLSLFKECITKGNEFTFILEVDTSYTSLVNINDIDKILKIVEEFYQQIIKMFKDAFIKKAAESFSDCNEANMFLGSGTGFLTKTVIACLAPNSKEAKDYIKCLLNKKFSKHKHLQLDKIISPRTLKITKFKGQQKLMGLVRIEKYE